MEPVSGKTKKESFDLGELVKKCQDKLAIEIKKKNHTVMIVLVRAPILPQNQQILS